WDGFSKGKAVTVQAVLTISPIGPGIWRRSTSTGVLGMSLDWLWGAAIGLGASVASGVLGWYKGAGALQQKQIDTADALAKLTVNFDNLKTDLTNKLEAYRREAELSEDSVHDQISGVLHEVSDMTTIVKVSLAEQNAGLKQTV